MLDGWLYWMDGVLVRALAAVMEMRGKEHHDAMRENETPEAPCSMQPKMRRIIKREQAMR
jgi:hypothetical protein